MKSEKKPERPPIQIKEEAETWLFKIPGVRAVGLGPKFVADRPIGKLAIHVYVDSKRPRATLDAAEVIPELIDGIPTDVWEYRKSAATQREITVDDCPTGVIEDMTAITSGTTVTHLEIRSTAHGLFDNTHVQIVAANTSSHVSLPVTLVNDDTFRVGVQRNGQDMTPVTLPYVANSARWVNACRLDTLCCCPTGVITFVGTAGDKVTIGSTAHGLLNGERVKIRKQPLRLEPQIHVVKVVDANNFELVGANAADFAGGPANWRWRKLSVAPTGLITRMQFGNPVVIHSAAHGLAKGDRIVIQSIPVEISKRLDNHVNRANAPYAVEIVDADRFQLTGIDATSWNIPDTQNDVVGSWIKVIQDFKKYGRKWGGIRIEMKESETETVLATREGEQDVRVTVKLSTGTLGCIAINLATGKKVLLSNAHVLFAGTDNDEVHHPDYYVSSRSCSKHKIGVRLRPPVNGDDPNHPGTTVDAAIARFDPDKGEYDPFIADIGAVEGTAEISDTDPALVNGHYRVWKRGAQTGITEGLVIDKAYTFLEKATNITWRNQLRIRPVLGDFQGFMSILGDSGAVLVNGENKVVGLISKAEEGGFATANPIREVELALGIKIWSINDPVAAGEEPPFEPGQGQTATLAIPDLFAGTLKELSASEGGAQLAEIVGSHVAETIQLMEVSKKFAALWHRNHGPELMQQLRHTIEVRNRRMPASIEGQPLPELVSAIFDALKKFGSAKLAAHALAYEQLVQHLLTYSYEEMLQFLKSNPPLSLKV
jgi:hypothetical protein